MEEKENHKMTLTELSLLLEKKKAELVIQRRKNNVLSKQIRDLTKLIAETLSATLNGTKPLPSNGWDYKSKDEMIEANQKK